jgi:hypothetical protein
MTIKYYALRDLNLIKVTKEGGLWGESYEVEGLSSDPSFWVELWKKDKTTCRNIAYRVWGRLPTPMLMGYYNEKENLEELALVDSREVSPLGNVGINTNCPFDLNDEDLALLKDKQEKIELEKEKRREAIKAKEDALFLKVQELLTELAFRSVVRREASDMDNPNLVLTDTKRRRADIRVMFKGIEVSTIRLEDFYKKVFPDDYNNLRS